MNKLVLIDFKKPSEKLLGFFVLKLMRFNISNTCPATRMDIGLQSI